MALKAKQVYGALTSEVKSIVSGIASWSVDDVNKTITAVTTGGQTLTIHFMQPSDGVGVDSVDLVDGHIIVTYTDTTTHDAGEFPIPTIEVGTTETVEPTEPAEVTAEDTATGIKLNFKIPRGESGGGTGEVTGVKGSAESTFRKGNVSISPANIGLSNVNNTSDSSKPVSAPQQAALDLKVDKVEGKVLSDNNYSDDDMAIVDGVTAALANKVDKVQGKGLSTNDYTDTDKAEVAKVANKADADDVIDGASYDSANHLILFKNGSTTLFSLDAAAFVKDGMVDTVEITGGNLVITFNTDAGKQAISIPLTDIFDPSNYYNKTATDGLLDDKADKVASAVNGNFAGLDANGNLTDSGKKAADFSAPSDIQDVYEVMGKNGAKNLIPSNHAHKDGIYNGVTLTNNDDDSITIDGTATGTTWIMLTSDKDPKNFPYLLKAGSYTLSQEGIATQVTGHAVAVLKSGATVASVSHDVPTVDFTLSEDTYVGIGVRLPQDLVLSNVTIKPMLRLASDTDSTYQPYAKTNKQLTDEKLEEVMYEEEVHGVNLNFMPYRDGMSKTVNGVTFTVNSDGSIKANGTASPNYAAFLCHFRELPYGMELKNGKYILSGSKGGSNSTYFIGANITRNGVSELVGRQYDNEVEITVNGDDYYNDKANVGLFIQIENGQTVNNLTFYPMLRKADIEDSTYRPYNYQAIQNQLNAQGVLGAKNLIGNPEFGRSGSYYTVQDDNSIVFNGTPSTNLFFNYGLNKNNQNYSYVIPIEPGKSYIVSGCPEGGNGSGSGMPTNYAVRCYAQFSDESLQWLGSDFGEGVKITVPSNAVYVFVQIAITAGTVLSNVIFRPMIRLASDPDDTYQPYAMTNRELTEAKTLTPTITSSAYTMTYQSVKRCGNIVQVWIRLKLSNSVSAGGNADGTVSGIPFPIGDIMNLAYNSANVIGVLLQTNGTLRIRAFSTLAADTDVDASFTYIAKQ